MKTNLLYVVGMIGCLNIGCASFPQTYKPATLGPVAPAQELQGLQVTLVPHQDACVAGQPVSFDVQIRNVGSAAITLSREPEVRVAWVYPTGRCDNELDAGIAPAAPARARMLAPGEQLVLRRQVTPYAGEKPGITEFRALLNLAGVSAAAGEGWLVSNSYGMSMAAAGGARPTLVAFRSNFLNVPQF